MIISNDDDMMMMMMTSLTSLEVLRSLAKDEHRAVFVL